MELNRAFMKWTLAGLVENTKELPVLSAHHHLAMEWLAEQVREDWRDTSSLLAAPTMVPVTEDTIGAWLKEHYPTTLCQPYQIVEQVMAGYHTFSHWKDDMRPPF